MANVYELDGIVFDPDTGEILETPEGTDDVVNLLVHRIKGYEEDAKTLQGYAGMYKAMVMGRQQEKVARYGDLKANIIRSTVGTFDIGAFRVWLMGEELSRQMLVRLLMLATGFDLKLLSDSELDQAIDKELTPFKGVQQRSPFLRIDRIVQAPPRLNVVEREAASA